MEVDANGTSEVANGAARKLAGELFAAAGEYLSGVGVTLARMSFEFRMGESGPVMNGEPVFPRVIDLAEEGRHAALRCAPAAAVGQGAAEQ